MSVCFFVNSDQAGASTSAEGGNENEGTATEETTCIDPLQTNLHKFWTKVSEDIEKITADDFKTQALPLARIKKIMKLDEEVKMISAEAPLLFAKAAEIFIHELTLRAWSHTEDNKRRTLQRNDIAMAISKSDQFDFLIDIVPRHESMVTNKPKKDPPPQRTMISTINQAQPATTMQQSTNTQPQLVLQPYTQIVQPPQTTSTPSVPPTATQQPLVLHQVMSNNDLQQVPLQLTQAQMNMIRFQMQNNPNQPIIIQAQPQQNQQIIQVSSQAQPAQQVYLQVAATQDTDS